MLNPAHAGTPEALEAVLDAMEASLVEDFRPIDAQAIAAERQAVALGRDDLRMRARLVTGEVLGRQGNIAESGRIAKIINMWAYEHSHPYLLARSHRQLATFFRRIGDSAQALTHAVYCLEYTPPGVPARIRAGHLVTLALVLDLNGYFDDANRRFAEALELATGTDDVQMCLRVLNNMAFTAYERGDAAGALDLTDQMRAIEDRRGVPLDGLYLDTIARVQLLLGRYDEVERTLRPVLDDPAGPLVTEGDALPECLLTVAEAQRRGRRLEPAQATLDQARQLCDERGLAAVGARVRLEQSELYAAAGRYREAYEEHRVFHAETEALRSAQREARAHALQVVFETEDARRNSERFHQLALRDPLTGLHNRRYVDEQVPILINRAANTGTPLSVALLDLDYFKQINDTLSHDTGDLVLCRVADLLTELTADGEVVARLGGEEFLLVLPGLDAAAAVNRCEQLRTALARYDWPEITGGLPVTASFGVTSIVDGRATLPVLLSRADRNLYAAKRAGRDRVVSDGSAPHRLTGVQ